MKNTKYSIKHKLSLSLLALLSNLIILPSAFSQSPDWSYAPVVDDAENNPIPIILFDEGHNNFHIANKSYYGFTKLLTADGYNIRPLNGPFVDDPAATPTSDFQHQKDLANILVIASPCQAVPCNTSVGDALTDLEVTEIHQWVEQGGSLLLIIDHPPFAQTSNLALAFGIDLILDRIDKLTFDVTNVTFNTINSNSDLILGRNTSEAISYIQTFTGTSFSINPNPPLDVTFEPVLELQAGVYQGIALNVGAGRVYISGEAAMFTTQLTFDGVPWGMHIASAAYNEQYLRNIVHWLDGRMSVISGKVSLADGTPVSGVTIQFVNQAGRTWKTVSDSLGNYISPRGMRNNGYIVTAISSVYDFVSNANLVVVGDSPTRNHNFTAVPK
ncbi:hypothetical protein MNBD_GAMMA22-2570 [hydrothermal vent metagenome]|uniref:DUF4350 domain-containing protein n=1 Tax=hydrothermal vent metagenome TaxID=652676 RepID=A0A3B1AP72_9ZZZZ